jgi:ABC-type Zn uptake system ZnuABC Zn-binding protein ZnuA
LKISLFIALFAINLVGTPAPAGAVSVVVTVQPLALLLNEVGGDRIEVHVLVPPGASPHSFEPKPSDLVRIARANAFLSVGGGLDDWAARIFATAHEDASGDSVPQAAATLLGLVGRASDPDHGRDQHDHRTADDPHIWLDPILVRDEIAPALAAFLSEHDPAGAGYYQNRVRVFSNRLDRLDRGIRKLLGTEARHYVAFHNAWRHFADRYGLEEIAVVQEKAGEEPTPRELADLVRAARSARLAAILIEPQLDPRLAETLSAEFGGSTVLVDPLGDPDDEKRSTYHKLLRFNARAFRKAMTMTSTKNTTRSATQTQEGR